MATQAHLRAVQDDEKPQRKTRKKLDVRTAAAQGNQLDLLIAMRDRIAKAVTDEKCPPRDLASLTKRLDDIADKIEAIRAAGEDDDADGDSGPAQDEAFDASAI